MPSLPTYLQPTMLKLDFRYDIWKLLVLRIELIEINFLNNLSR